MRRLMADPEAEVAIPALRGAGSLGDASLVPFLLVELRRPSRRPAARSGLVRLGRSVLPALETYLWDARLEYDVRRILEEIYEANVERWRAAEDAGVPPAA